MEDWEITFIDKNIDKLIATTCINFGLITILQSDGIFSGEEIENLHDSNISHIQRVHMLYSWAKMRSNGFSRLKSALYKTNQTGAFQILNNLQKEHFAKYEILTFDESNPIYSMGNTIHVHRGEFGTRMALVKLVDYDCKHNLQQASNEVDLLTRLDWHENIVRCFIGKFITSGFKQYFAIALDYKLTLEDLYSGEKKAATNTSLPLSILKQVLNGVHFLHGNRIIHLNLQPGNVFIKYIDESYASVKVGEFGLSQQLKSGEDSVELFVMTMKEVGASCFFTPEVLKYWSGRHTYKPVRGKGSLDSVKASVGCRTDMFCLGIIIYFILSDGIHPYGDELDQPYLIKENKPHIVKEHLDMLDVSWKENFQKMLSSMPEDRPEIGVIIDDMNE